MRSGDGSNTHDDNVALKPRSYQLEMLEESLKRNIIVAMDTGSGKTHIAVLRIQAELERCLPQQLVWFLAPTVALCHQQYEVLRIHLPQYQTRFLSGEDKVDRWSNQTIWDAVLLNMQIIVSTHKVLEDALTHGFVQIAKLALLVYDEAHHCTGKHPANKILQDFYHPKLANGDAVPHILGLTASPVINATAGGLEAIERNMNAVSRTPKVHRSEMLQYVHRPLLIKVPYTATVSSVYDIEQSSLLHALRHAYANLDLMRDPYVMSILQSEQPDAQEKLHEVFRRQKTYCQVQMKTLVARAEDIYRELGAWAAEWYIKTCISNFMDAVDKRDWVSPKVTPEEMQYLCSIFKRINASIAQSQAVLGAKIPAMSSKAQTLINILAKDAGSAFTGLVFVQQRATVAALQALLANHPEMAQVFKVSTFVGTSTYSVRKTSIAELVEPRNQKGVLDDFRSGQTNLIIATSVLEEGIDVSACHTVICFEEPKNLKAFIQRRGRARKKESKYIILVEGDHPSTGPEKWQDLEEQMKQKYLNDMREVQAIQELEDAEDEGQRSYRIELTGALLTLENAVQHLQHFCATLSASSYVDLKPEYSVQGNMAAGLVSAMVILPTAVDPALRRWQSSQSWKTERRAKKDAAFEACIGLHRAGLINDHLMPLLTKKDEDVLGDELVEERPAIVTVSEKLDPWVAVALRCTGQSVLPSTSIHASPLCSEQNWFRSVVTLQVANCVVSSMVLLLSIELPDLPPFMLYWNEHIEYQVTIQRLPQSQTPWLSSDVLSTAQEITHVLLKSVFGVRIAEDQFDFPAMILPDENWEDLMGTRPEDCRGFPNTPSPCSARAATRLAIWLQTMQGSREASHSACLRASKGDVGLVRIKGRANAAYIFEGFDTQNCSSSENSNAELKLHVRVSKLPKRRDFLHPTILECPGGPQKPSYTKTELFPAEDCMIDVLPFKYSLFSLFVPSILYRVECFMLAKELRSTILAPVEIDNLALVLEAMTTSSARENTDYQRLEFLGDCIFGLCTAVHLMAKHPSWPEGFLTRSKGNSNSNSYLARAALRLGLDKFIITTPFTGAKWRPTYVSDLLKESLDEKREMSTKVLADVVEALIGASSIDGGMSKMYKCLEVLLPELHWTPLDESHALLYHAVPTTAAHPIHMNNLERLLGYTFNKPALFQEAITHPSFNADSTSLSYQRLEFLGDAVLDYLVVQQLFAHEPPYKERRMHTIRSALVNADFLAFLCVEWSIEQERAQVVEDEEAKTFSTVEVTVSQSAWQYMRHNDGQIAKAQQAAVGRHNDLRDEIIEMLETGDKYPWALLARTEADKFFSDLVESLLGAVYVDSQGDMQACANVVEKLGLFRYARRIISESGVEGGGIHLLHPKEELGQLADRERVRYDTRNSKERGWVCVVSIGAKEIVEVEKGTSRVEAETRAATVAVEMLKGRMGSGRAKRRAEEELGKEVGEGGRAVERVDE